MTRFARAHGSKASNERQPEEATTWNELKKQMLQQQPASKNHSKDLSKKHTLLQKNEADKKVKWAEFEEVPFPTNKKKENKEKVNMKETVPQLSDLASSNPKKLKKKDKLHQIKNKREKVIKTEKILDKKLKSKNDINSGELETIVRNVKKEKVSKEGKQVKKQKVLTSDSPVVADIKGDANNCSELKTSGSVEDNCFKLTKKQLKRKKHLQKKQQSDVYVSKSSDASDISQNGKVNDKNVASAIGMPSVIENIVENDLVECKQPKLSKRQLQRTKTNLKKKLPDRFISASASSVETSGETGESTNIGATVTPKLTKRQKRNLKLKKTKPITDPSTSELGPKPTISHKRRKPNQPSKTTTMIINGQEVDVTMFDGFPVRTQDAENLRDLRKKMIDNGIPVDEVKVAMKLERRKAEKALARERRKVCFHCRKSGHNLSDCPNLEEGSNQNAGTMGICFKCGSTEHTHFECRVNRGEEYRFAKCFICQEQGHISRQCPDNPRGLYPKGGACKVCGDVTHLKKDCPDLREGKEQHAITVETSRVDKPEALDEDFKEENDRPANKAHLNKVIKF